MRVGRAPTRVISDITIDQNIPMATYKLTGLGAGSGDNDSARYKQLVDGLALKLALAGGTMSGNIAMGTKKLTGLGAPTAQNDSLRYGQAEIRTNEIAAAAGILLSQLEDAVCSETEAAGLISDHTGDVDAHHAVLIATTGQYTGNNTVNRAIPHGLGATPKIVLILQADGVIKFMILGVWAQIGLWNVEGGVQAVTIPNTTNFYVGNAAQYSLSANATGVVYDWVAFG